MRLLLRPALCAFGVAVAVGGLTARAEAPLTHHAERATKPDGVRIARVDNTPSSHVPLPCGVNPLPVVLQQPPPPPPGTICDGTYCVSLAAVSASIHQQLDCNVMGYAFFVGNSLTGANALFGSYGTARTSKNPPAANFTPDSKMQIASTSKVLTGLAALKIMGSDINKPAYTYFPWTTPANSIVRNITSRQFVSQTSGVMKYDANNDVDSDLQTFLTQPTPNPGAPADCDVANPQYPILAPNQYCYSNVNFAIMRDVLPMYVQTTSTDPLTLADKYVGLVTKNVFTPVGVSNVGCTASATTAYALGYYFPATGPGTTFNDNTQGDLRLNCGAWGWWVSVRDYASVLVSLNNGDGKILNACGVHDMITNPAIHAVGWDTNSTDGQGHRWIEKNGGDGWATGQGVGSVSTSVVLWIGRDGCVVKGKGIAAIPGVAAALFINSNFRGADPFGLFNGKITGPGPLALSGGLVSGGTASLGVANQVIAFSSNSADTTQTLQVTGSLAGQPKVDTLVLNGTSWVYSADQFDVVTKVVVTGGPYPSKGTITVGTNSTGGADGVLLRALQAGTTHM